MKTDFFNLTLEQLENYFIINEENKAKAVILYKEIYRNRTLPENIPQLSEKTKQMILNDFSFSLPKTVAFQEDGETAKALLELSDGNKIESVIMRHSFGAGLCVSSQVGCAMNCSFCQSGKLKKRRNLTAGEMAAQVVAMSKITPINHISIMGIGEPLDNFDNVKAFMEIISSPYGTSFGARHITLSTCGFVPAIKKLDEIKCGFNLAVSLHASNDSIRSLLMPINKQYGLNLLIDSVREYSKKHKKRIAFEYILLDGINDKTEYAVELADLIKDIDCFVNLIPYNSTDDTQFKPSQNSDVFFRKLKSLGINAIFRREFGKNIKAACGQLSSDYE